MNVRLALTGIGLLNGLSRKQAAIEAGYTPSTASCGYLTNSRAVAEAAKLDPERDPANLLVTARGRLAQLLADDSKWQRAKIGEVARLIETTERYFGAGHPLDSLGERETLEERGQLVAALTRFVEAKAASLKESAAESRAFATHNSEHLGVIPSQCAESAELVSDNAELTECILPDTDGRKSQHTDTAASPYDERED